MSDYNELKCLAELACPGPWMQENDDLYFNDDGYTRHLMFTDSGHDVCDDECCDSGHRDNLKFIAAANPAAVLALIAENESMRTSIEYQKCYIESLRAELRESYAIISSPETP